MEQRWMCRQCGKICNQPTRRWDFDDGVTATATDYCPRCGSTDVEELERCPVCDRGWKSKSERVCEKCHLQLLGELQRFARRFSPEALAELDDMLEGNGLEQFT